MGFICELLGVYLVFITIRRYRPPFRPIPRKRLKHWYYRKSLIVANTCKTFRSSLQNRVPWVRILLPLPDQLLRNGLSKPFLRTFLFVKRFLICRSFAQFHHFSTTLVFIVASKAVERCAEINSLEADWQWLILKFYQCEHKILRL